MRADLDALGAQGDMGWYCCSPILWANRYQMPRTVTAMPAPQFTDAGVVVSCGATFTWEDGRLETYRCSFTAHTTMSLLVQGAKGTLHVEDFVVPIEEARASYSLVSEATFTGLLVGWENKPQFHSVSVAVPQEAEMIKKMSKLVKNVRDEGGKADSFWPEITRKTQVLVNAVMDSIHANFSTINIA